MATVARTIPADPAECAGLLVEAAGDRRTVRIIGSGTKSYLGDVGATDVELSTERLAGVIDHVPADLTVTLGAGTRMADVAAALARVGQFLPLDPPHADAATIGGVIAANSNGFWRARYGGVRDLLIGTSTALTDGTIARAGGRVVKNVAGYDLDKLLVGSLGTLGVIVEATLKVLPLPEKSDGLVARFDRPADAFGTAHAVVRAPSRVDACVVERSAEGSWILAVQSRGGGPTVDRALRDARREVTTRHGDATDLGDDLRPMRELPARAIDGALVRVSLPLAASRVGHPHFPEAAAARHDRARIRVIQQLPLQVGKCLVGQVLLDPLSELPRLDERLVHSILLGLDHGAGPLRGQSRWNLDLTVSKELKFTERFNARFIATFSNIMNHPWFTDPYLDLFDQADFGSIYNGVSPTGNIQINSPRQIEFGLRVGF